MTGTPTPVIAAPDDDLGSAAAGLDYVSVLRELIKQGGLHEFMRQFWNLPQTFQNNWHIEAICEYLTAVQKGEIKKLVINVPPATGKSLTVGVMFNAYLWAMDPGKQFLFGSFDQSLLNLQSEKVIDIMRSEDYQLCFPDTRLKHKKPALREFQTTKGGARFNTSPTGKGTGRHVDGIIIDDPMKPQDAIQQSDAAFAKVDNWFDGTLQTRYRDFIILIMQRLHTRDLAGRCLEDGYESLILPMRMTKRAMWARDPRTEGELLWPSNPRFSEERVRLDEIKLKHEASAQLQQDPTPATGGFIEEPWTRLEWVEPPSKGRWCSSWDFSSKSAQESHSKVAGHLWCATRDTGVVREYLSDLADRLARIPGAAQDVRICPRIIAGETYYLLVDWVGGYWNFPASKAQFVMTHNRPLWKMHARVKLIEAKANGIPLIDEFKDKFVGIRPVEPEGTKEERVRVHTEKFELGQVIFAPGADPVREELIKFPRFTHDDHVDCATQALDFLANRNARYRENLAKIAGSAGGMGRLLG